MNANRFHTFLGFITDETRCQDPRLVIFSTYHHEQMAKRCLGVLQEFQDNAVVDNVDGKYNSFDGPLEGVTREEVKYAIQYCWSHICQVVAPSESFLSELQAFLRQNCVRWLALRCAVNMADGLITALESLGEWVNQHNIETISRDDKIMSTSRTSHTPLLCKEIASLLKGLADFSTTYLELISTSPSHIYSSAVAFIPPATSIEFLRERRQNIPRVIVGLRRTWQPFITLRSHESDINFATFSRSGALLVTVSAQTVNIWKVQTLHRPHSSLKASSFAYGDSFTVARFTADDGSLILGFRNGYVATWNLTEEKLQNEPALFAASRVVMLRCILEGHLAAAVSWEGRLSLWNYDTGKISLKDSAQFGNIQHVALNHRRQVAVAGHHSGEYRVQRIEYGGDPVQLKAVSPDFSTKDTLMGMKYTTEGEHIVVVSISGITLINSKDGSVMRQFSFAEVKDFQSACLSIKGQGGRDYLMVALVSGSMELWEISADSPSSDSEWAVLRKTIQRGNPQKILAMSANGTSVVLGKYSADAIFWNVRGATASDEPDLGPTGEHLWAPTFSPHGSLFAAACTGNFIRIWSCTAKTDQPATTIQCEEVGTSLNLALSHDDKLLACAREKAVSVFDLQSREEVALFIPPSMHSIKSCFHPSEAKLALVASTDDDHITIVIWGYKADNIIFEWRSQEPFSGEPQNIIFSRTGRFLAASWQRNRVINIDLEQEDMEKSANTVQFPRSVYRLAFSEDEMCLWGETDEEQDALTWGIGSCQWWFRAGARPFFTSLHHHDCPFNFKLNKDGWVVRAPASRASKNERLFRIPTLDLEEHVFSPGNSAKLAYIDLEGQLVLVDFSTLFSGQ
ncbi:WD40 repeat-like protein [Sistotremastrum niveocremeum HHB9708]|uniref:WD40 repeat-like protein n=1 Tax=Sistotremastrum niveocremeum HHB9708 TaxID=1314777 RepID=A0A164SI99_9AGAM|nr:WD40 repeat-like protein [Sistotremastrum niveocremeum HHB9708]